MTRLGARWGWGIQQQMDLSGTHVPFENFDVLTATDFPDQIPHAVADLPTSTGLRYFVVNTKWSADYKQCGRLDAVRAWPTIGSQAS
jgi:hypothetical protein